MRVHFADMNDVRISFFPPSELRATLKLGNLSLHVTKTSFFYMLALSVNKQPGHVCGKGHGGGLARSDMDVFQHVASFKEMLSH